MIREFRTQIARDILGALAHLTRNLQHKNYDYEKALHDLCKAQKILSEIGMHKIAIDNGGRGPKYSKTWWLDTESILMPYQVNFATTTRSHVRKVLPLEKPSLQPFKATTAGIFVENVQQHLKREFENNSPIIEKLSKLLPPETADAEENPDFFDLLQFYADDLGEVIEFNVEYSYWKSTWSYSVDKITASRDLKTVF